MSDIRYDYQGNPINPTAKAEIPKINLRFDYEGNPIGGLGQPGVAKPPQPFTKEDLESFATSKEAGEHLVGDQILNDEQFAKLQKTREENPILSTLGDIMHTVGDPGMSVGSGEGLVGMAGKIANLFKNVGKTDLPLNVLGGVSPRARNWVKAGKSIKDLFREIPEETQFKPNPNIQRKLKIGND